MLQLIKKNKNKKKQIGLKNTKRLDYSILSSN